MASREDPKAAAEAARSARDKRIRSDFKRQVDVQCASMIEHLYGVVKASRVGAASLEQEGEGNTGTAAAELAGAAEQERLRRDGFHVTYHAESLIVAGDALLNHIHDLRLNLVMASAQSKVNEISSTETSRTSSDISSSIGAHSSSSDKNDSASKSDSSSSSSSSSVSSSVGVDKKRKADGR